MNKFFVCMLIAFSSFVGSTALAETKSPRYSTIQADGHLVPVGDHHLFRYDYLPWNVSTSPLFVIGHYSLSVERAITDYVAARVSGSYTDLVDSSEPASANFNVSAPVYFRKMQDGFFFEPSVGVRYQENTEADEYGYNYYEDEQGMRAYLASQVGWRLIWDSGLNVTAAAGMGRRFASDSRDDIFATGRFDIGFSF